MLDLIADEETTYCQGTVFKASVQNCRTAKGGFRFQVHLVPMKKMSCPGCEKCGWQSENFSEVNNDWPINGIESCEDGKFYFVSTCNESKDWETGQVDEWKLCLSEYHTNTNHVPTNNKRGELK